MTLPIIIMVVETAEGQEDTTYTDGGQGDAADDGQDRGHCR